MGRDHDRNRKKSAAVKRDGNSRKAMVLVIVGAGASGMLAAVSARRSARALGVADGLLRIRLLERNAKPGAKIAISGGGKCNLTHDGGVDLLLERGFLRMHEQRFVRPSIYAFSNNDLLELFARYGVQAAPRDDGRVFPCSGIAGDVVAAMERMLRDAAAELETGVRVDGIEVDCERFTVRSGELAFPADALVLAAGGSAWGSSGTTGDGVRLAASVGHAVVPVLPALAPVFFERPPDPELVGVTLRGVALVAESGTQRDRRIGDVLVSHRGISGPACLSLSRSVAGMMAGGGADVTLSVDFFPGMEEAALTALVIDYASRHGSRLLQTFLQRCPLPGGDGTSTIPNAFIPLILSAAGIGREQTAGTLAKGGRRKLVSALKLFPLGRARKVPLDRAEVSAGGVALREVDPKRMQSRLHRRLFCCGELLDYAAEVGGFNLQAAFSTGWTAGANAVRELYG